MYRFTLVKDFNLDEIQNYAQLISRGSPDFIEVKGVTFCGYTGSQPLTMSNVIKVISLFNDFRFHFIMK